MAEAEPIQWRRDATTSRTVRTLWTLGVGTLFATICLIIYWRLFMLAGQAGDDVLSITPIEGVPLAFTSWQLGSIAVMVAIAVTIVALALSRRPEASVRALFERLSLSPPGETVVSRALDAALGTVVMLAVIAALIGGARVVAQGELDIGAGVFTFLAAISIPLALVALVFASFLSSVGSIDGETGYLYLYDPEERIDLEHLEDCSVRTVGGTAIVSLEYATPDGQYVPGPRRLVVPVAVATELEGLVAEAD